MSRKTRKNRFLFRLARRTEGAAAVEFAIVLTCLLLLITGIMDFGHAFFVKQIVTNASREGARYGVVYQEPRPTEPEIKEKVNFYLESAGLTDPSTTTVAVVPGTGATGTPLTVTVSSTKTWWVINRFVPGLEDTVVIDAQTRMRYE
ncbi:MAG: TadE/TadG family type IV pilus assembly protein [Pseudomonadota bacterium]